MGRGVGQKKFKWGGGGGGVGLRGYFLPSMYVVSQSMAIAVLVSFDDFKFWESR